MTERTKLTPAQTKSFLLAMVADTICIFGGVFLYLQTNKVIWIVCGILAGIGFSVPAVIQLMRAKKEQQNNAPR